MKKVHFYYVRHGETVFNIEDRLQGACDSPLTEKGVKEGIKAGELLKDVEFRAVHSSDLKRCRETVKLIVGERNIPVNYVRELREISFGSYEGVKVASNYEDINYRRKVSQDWEDLGGENGRMVISRIEKILKQIYDECDNGDNILLVSHGIVFMLMLPGLFNIDFSGYLAGYKGENNPIPNGYVGMFDMSEKGYELLKINGDFSGWDQKTGN